ncbi:cysteine hydrolase [Stenotrophomonas sp. ZAC14D2_NAIMI4_7]|uniref:cysteine hydrolase family protein n=1 Tax=Stenotrophomonas sp. ZAC14D2_NAIMI4_7 TaxID=2072405 RepID=UPI000D54065D|nr:isochorismatase family cysteine hydrolase [Stenotrophomonas sp. ZAC14D2_NAIMI4_7]AWH18446.1 cysteine hydrolase [Stenotrophomonas sp. ZAC14D2_NAIMI4_7]
MSTPALVIVDMFSRFDFPDGERLAPVAVEAAHAIYSIRQDFDERDWPVIYANDNFGNWKCGFHELADQCLQTPGMPQEIARTLLPKPNHYSILKPKHSAFLSTPLQILLQKLEAGPLVLTGMALDSCVLATAIDANSREYECLVVEQAVACLPERRSPSLDVLGQSGAARVVSAGSLLPSLGFT